MGYASPFRALILYLHFPALTHPTEPKSGSLGSLDAVGSIIPPAGFFVLKECGHGRILTALVQAHAIRGGWKTMPAKKDGAAGNCSMSFFALSLL
jgi:hypothetical protein